MTIEIALRIIWNMFAVIGIFTVVGIALVFILHFNNHPRHLRK